MYFTMLYVFLTCLTSQEDCNDLQCGVVLSTEDHDVCSLLLKLTRGKNGAVCHPSTSSSRGKKFTTKEREIIDEIFSFHPTLKGVFLEKTTCTQKFSKVTANPLACSGDGDEIFKLTIDDFECWEITTSQM